MTDRKDKTRTLADTVNWRMTEMRDRGLALLKVLPQKNTSGVESQVVVVVRSNGIALFHCRDKNSITNPKDKILFLGAQDISLQNLSVLFNPREAAECLAVFNYNRRSLLQVVSNREENNEKV